MHDLVPAAVLVLRVSRVPLAAAPCIMSLSNLLVQRELATIRDVEEALARQVLYGGDLATNLLEVAHLDEDRLTGLLAESYGMLPAPSGELGAVSPEVLALVSKEQAGEHGILPLALDAGAVVIASSGPLNPGLLHELGFATSRPIVVKIAPIFRIYQAIARDYGTPLLRRHVRLLARLAAKKVAVAAPAALASAPLLPHESALLPHESAAMNPQDPAPVLAQEPALMPPQEPEVRAEPFGPNESGPNESNESGPNESGPNESRPNESGPNESNEFGPNESGPNESNESGPNESGPGVYEERAPHVPHESATAAEAQPTVPQEPADATPQETRAPSNSAPPLTVMEPAVARAHEALRAQVGDTVSAEAAAPDKRSAEPDDEADTRQTQVVPPIEPESEPEPGLPETFASGGTTAHNRPGKRRRGPLTFDVAKKEMDEASERDHVLDLFFEFSRVFFEYCAFFIVHGDAADGRDAAGQGALRDKVAGISVPLDAPSVLATSRKALVPVFTRHDGAGIDAVLFRDLERDGRCAVGLVPVVVRRRVVAVLLGDDGDTHVEASAMKDVTSFAALAGAAFERLIVRKKQGEKSDKKASVPPRISSRPDASALSRMIGAAASSPPQIARPAVAVTTPEPPPPEVPVQTTSVDRPASEPPATVAEPGFGGAGTARAAAALAPRLAREEPASLPPAKPETEPPHTPRGFADPDGQRDDTFSLSDPAPPEAAPYQIALPPAARLPRDVRFEEEAPSSKRVVQVPQVARSEAGLSHSTEPHPREPAADPAVEELPPAPESQAPPDFTESDFSSLGAETHEAPASLAVPAHLPPPSRSDRPKVLPSVMVDTGNEYMELVDRVVRSSDELAETKLLHAGQHAMPAILARFPGPVRLDVSALPEGALPRAGECGPVLRLIARQRRVALPFVLTLVDEPNPDRRFWATYLLSELPYVEAIDPAVLALFDGEPRVRLAARTSVRILAELYPSYTVERLARVLAEPTIVVVRRVIALQMLGEVRDPVAVPHLLPRLVDPQPEVAAAARASLTLVCRQDFGVHLSHWNEWFDQNRGRQRVEWLIDALGNAAGGLRLAALEELVKLTRNAFGYHDDMPKRDRERVMQKFRDWWVHEGKARYGR